MRVTRKKWIKLNFDGKNKQTNWNYKIINQTTYKNINNKKKYFSEDEGKFYFSILALKERDFSKYSAFLKL